MKALGSAHLISIEEVFTKVDSFPELLHCGPEALLELVDECWRLQLDWPPVANCIALCLTLVSINSNRLDTFCRGTFFQITLARLSAK